MFSIKSSFADCSTCKLLEAPSCIMETNSEKDLSKVDIVIIAENPGKEEIKKNPPTPLVGPAGKMFRKYFNKYLKDKCNWVITNCVLCATIDPESGKTLNPDDDVIDKCKENCFNIIRACNPKLIFIMGTSPMKAFDIAKSGITTIRGQYFKWEDYDVLITVHPSYIQRGNYKYEPDFENDIIQAGKFLGVIKEDQYKTSKVQIGKVTKNKGIQRYEIPAKFYTPDYRLVDIQTFRNGEILYIFRDKDNKKVYHKESDNYLYYVAPDGVEARCTVPYDQLLQASMPYRQKTKIDHKIAYEGDMRLTAKHGIDYYHYNQGEAPFINANIMFFDIEVDTGVDNPTFPQPSEALYPINMITTSYHKHKICFILDNGTEPITEKGNTELRIFKDEKTMMNNFFKYFKDTDPDFLCGWNSIGFDAEYIFNRVPKLKIKPETFSKFNEFYVDGFRFACALLGCVVLDQMHLYKSFTFTKLESYRLDFVADKELKKKKIVMPYPINQMYWLRLNELIEYNIKDTELIEELEDKVKHINLANEIRVICCSSFEAAASQFGQIDSIIVNHLKEQGLASKNANPDVHKKKYPGAFVLSPIPGIYDKATDFDFTSLYPSLIITYNVGMNNFVMRTEDPEMGYNLCYAPENLPEMVPMILDPMYKKQELKMRKEDVFKHIKDKNLICTINGCFFKHHDEEKSVYSEVLEHLLTSRKQYKKQMLEAKEAGNESDKNLYNTRQLVYKVLANSLYGVVANKAFRFFNVSCAAAITLGGQEALKHSIIYGEEIMRSLHKGGNINKPKMLTKKEIYTYPDDETGLDRDFSYIITGDTDSIFCCFQEFGQKTDEELRGLCDTVQTYLNEEIIPEVVQRHNAPMKYNRLELKNELIISRGLFLAKKRYAIHVTNQEGKVIDDVNYMGIEVKRSDYPSASKDFLKELLDIILKTPDIKLSKIFKFVQSKEKEFIHLIKSGDKSIARPVSFGKEIKDYKSMPQGVKAMLSWNDIVYNAHHVGSRGYLFRVAGFDYDKAPEDVKKNYDAFLATGKKLEVIAIPDEDDKLPEYFVPDLKANLKFAFEDRYNLLLKPLTDVKKKQEILTI